VLRCVRGTENRKPSAVMAGLVPAIHVFGYGNQARRGCPGQARAWRGWPHPHQLV